MLNIGVGFDLLSFDSDNTVSGLEASLISGVALLGKHLWIIRE